MDTLASFVSWFDMDPWFYLDGHLIILVASLRAGVLLVDMLGAATVVENGDLDR